LLEEPLPSNPPQEEAAATRSTLSQRHRHRIHTRSPSPLSDPPWEGGERGQREPSPLDPSSSAAGSTRGRRRRRHRCRIYRGREARWRGGDGERGESIRGSLGLPVSDHSLRLKLLASEYHHRLHVFALQEDLHGDGIVDLAGNSREKEGLRRCCG
ncbi:Os03g0744100, partial [Oryza sativa Japonica Group]